MGLWGQLQKQSRRASGAPKKALEKAAGGETPAYCREPEANQPPAVGHTLRDTNSDIVRVSFVNKFHRLDKIDFPRKT